LSNHLQEIVENIDKYRIGLDDVFTFKCRSCGKCCKNREDIILNSRDVYNIATALELTHEQVIEKYCDTYIGHTSRMPIVRLMPKGQNRVCPLLTGDRCSVHLLKPTVCALYPIGRVVPSENAPEEMGLGNPNEVQYIINPITCGSLKRKQTVRAWLEAFKIPTEDTFFIEWNKIVSKLHEAVRKYEGMNGVTEKAMDMIWSAIFQSLYIDYDAQKDFYPQFSSNTAKILSFFEKLNKTIWLKEDE